MTPSIIYSRLFHSETRHASCMQTDHRCFGCLHIPRPVNCCNLCIYARHHLWNGVSQTQHAVQQYPAQPTKSTGFLSHLRLRETLTYGLIKQVSRVAQPLVGQTKPQRHRAQANWHVFFFFLWCWESFKRTHKTGRGCTARPGATQSIPSNIHGRRMATSTSTDGRKEVCGSVCCLLCTLSDLHRLYTLSLCRESWSDSDGNSTRWQFAKLPKGRVESNWFPWVMNWRNSGTEYFK